MTGAEHYAEAERLLGIVADPKPLTRGLPDVGGRDMLTVLGGITARANAHATLALAAAMERHGDASHGYGSRGYGR